MKKNILFFGALVGALLLVSCSGGNKKQDASSAAPEELDNASKVINYYHTSVSYTHLSFITMFEGSNPVSLVRLVPIPKEQRILFLQYS